MMMSRALPTPKVSVIIPTCGRPELLLECVASIVRNDFTDFEILVVDQDPTQGLRVKLSEKFDAVPRIVYLFLDEAALDKARNKGIEHARGDILVFIDDDVEVDVGWLGAYVNAFTGIQPPPGVVGGRLDPLWLCPRPDWYPEEKEYLLGIYQRGGELAPMPEPDLPIGANFAVLRQCVDEVGRFDERMDYSYARKFSRLSGGDSLFCLRAKQAKCSIYYQPQARAWHKISKTKLTKEYFIKRNFWEGATRVVTLHLSGSSIVADLCRNIGSRAGLPSEQSPGNLLRAKAWMRLVAVTAFGLGMVYASARIRWTGSFLGTTTAP
jgi:glycosyltransferase involved in cell wall biosynthesis